VCQGQACRPYLAGIPSPRVSLARGAGLLLALFTLAFWQRTAERLGVPPGPRHQRVTRTSSLTMVLRGVFSRAGFETVLKRLDRVFAKSAERLRRGGGAGGGAGPGTQRGGGRGGRGPAGAPPPGPGPGQRRPPAPPDARPRA